MVLGLFPLQLNAISDEIYTTVCKEHTYTEFNKKAKNSWFKSKTKYKIKYDAKNNILLDLGSGAIKKQFYKYSEREVSNTYAIAYTYAAKTNVKPGKEIAVLKTVILKDRKYPFIMVDFEVTTYIYSENKQLALRINNVSVKEFESNFIENENYNFIEFSRAYFKCEPENTRN